MKFPGNPEVTQLFLFWLQVKGLVKKVKGSGSEGEFLFSFLKLTPRL